jgi:hypothetical protein
MNNVNYDANRQNIIVPNVFGDKEPLSFPKEAIAELTKLGSLYNIEKALWFYRVVGERDYAWVEAKDLVGVDITDYDVYYYEANYEDSGWELADAITMASFEGVSDTFAFVHIEDEDDENLYGWTFRSDSELLVVKPTPEEQEKAREHNGNIIYDRTKLKSADTVLYPKGK